MAATCCLPFHLFLSFLQGIDDINNNFLHFLDQRCAVDLPRMEENWLSSPEDEVDSSPLAKRIKIEPGAHEEEVSEQDVLSAEADTCYRK